MKKKLIALVATTALMVTVLIGVMPMSASAAVASWVVSDGASAVLNGEKVTITTANGTGVAVLTGSDDLTPVEDADWKYVLDYTINVPKKSTDASEVTISMMKSSSWGDTGFIIYLKDLNTDAPKAYVSSVRSGQTLANILQTGTSGNYSDASASLPTDGVGQRYFPIVFGTDVTFRASSAADNTTGRFFINGERYWQQNLWNYANQPTANHTMTIDANGVVDLVIDKGTAPAAPAPIVKNEWTVVGNALATGLDNGNVNVTTVNDANVFAYVAGGDDIAMVNGVMTFQVGVPCKSTDGSKAAVQLRSIGGSYDFAGFKAIYKDLNTDEPKLYIGCGTNSNLKSEYLLDRVADTMPGLETDAEGHSYYPVVWGEMASVTVDISGGANAMKVFLNGTQVASGNAWEFNNMATNNAVTKGLVVLESDGVANIMINKGTAPTVAEQVAELGVETLAGGSVRLDTETKGLRFTSYVTEADLAKLEAFKGFAGVTYEFGTLMMPTAGLTGDLTLDTTDVLKVAQTQWLDPIGCPEGTKRMTAVLWNIPAEAYGMEITARAYLKVTLDDQSEVVLYSTATAASVADVAAAAYADQEGQGYEAWELNILKEYAGITE